jgi:cation:H+ antiporter
MNDIWTNDYVWVAAGFVLLILGAEALVRGGVAVARRFRVSSLLIGLTVIAYGTSAPELLVSVNAASHHAYGIAVGNVVGSNILNILLILGVTAIISPILVPLRAIGRDGLFALLSAGLLVWFGLNQPVLGQSEGILFLAILFAILLIAYTQERGRDVPVAESRFQSVIPHSAIVDFGLILVGFALLLLGADALVKGSVHIARANGVSEAVIGLTLVAAGTSLPELVTSGVAALRGQSEIALGNIIGSNIYNILAVLGVASLLGPVRIDPELVQVDMWVMLAATGALFLPLLVARRVGRTYGLLLLAGYLGYLAYLLQKAGLITLNFGG